MAERLWPAEPPWAPTLIEPVFVETKTIVDGEYTTHTWDIRDLSIRGSGGR